MMLVIACVMLNLVCGVLGEVGDQEMEWERDLLYEDSSAYRWVK